MEENRAVEHIHDVSFVIIAFNEEFAIEKCFNSLARMKLINCEVICVDSGSKDNTLAVIRSFNGKIDGLRIFLISGYASAAVARNVGIKNVCKKYVYFVDGDVELFEGFIIKACNKIEDGYADAVSGELQEYEYSLDRKRVIGTVNSRFNIKDGSVVYLSGGNFLVNRDVFHDVGLFDEIFERSQDLEFTLRLTRKYKMIFISEYMGIHHTVPYRNIRRVVTDIYRSQGAYLGMAIHRNLNNPRGLFEFFLRIYGNMLGLVIIFIFLLVIIFFPTATDLLIMTSLFCLDLLYGSFKKQNIIYRIMIHYITPFYILFGLFCDLDPRREYSVSEQVS